MINTQEKWKGLLDKKQKLPDILKCGFESIYCELEKSNSILSLDELEKVLSTVDIQDRKKILIIDWNIGNNNIESDDWDKSNKYYFQDNENEKDSINFSNFWIYRLQWYLKKHEIPSEVVRLESDYKNNYDFMKKVENSDIIWMSTLSINIEDTFKFCLYIKKRYPNKIIIGWAEHFALDYDRILKNKNKTWIDICCTSQWELPILAMSLGIENKNNGSIAYIDDSTNKLNKNPQFDRLNENDKTSRLGKPAPATDMSIEDMSIVMPELKEYFNVWWSTQTQSWCQHKCSFCTNNKFMWNGTISTLQASRQEIENLNDNNVDFLYVRDPMLNTSPKHLGDFLQFMSTKINNNDKRDMWWFAFMSVRKKESLQRFKEMAKAWCIMIWVWVEDVVWDRKNLKKWESLEAATEFINKANNYVMVRALMMLWLPSHYEYSREKIKGETLNFMKKNPQSVYRFNIRTPIIWTDDFKENSELLEKDIREDIWAFKEHDTWHSVIDPKKMYDKLNIAEDKRWVKDKNDRDILRTEIMKEYFESKEFKLYLNFLEEKEDKLYYNITKKHKDMWI